DDGLLIAGVDDGTRVEAVGTVTVLLLVAVPLLVAVMALVTWLAVGRALRPVERIRHDTEQVTAAGLGRRIDRPGTGDEIDRLAGTMNRMLDHLEQSDRRQRRFVSDASHELRSPLSALRQSAEVAAAYPASMPATKLAGIVAEESERMAGLVDGLLLLARADEHGLALDRREVDLDDLVLAEARRLRELDHALVVDASGVTACRVSGDAALLARALRNLVDNARRHARTRITLACASRPTSGAAGTPGLEGADRAGGANQAGLVGGADWVVVSVSDDGAGIPEAERERVFERFVRLDESRARDSGGSGLGLAIVRSIARAHGGEIEIGESAEPGGRVIVKLPLQARPNVAAPR
ncbi:MAG: ATP-binding protein, partial [Solirubrobacteraceae bacterium]|nr:ATP-binding protein [Solirubrobacteraceae bacterium]